jgi:hypothetical protein
MRSFLAAVLLLGAAARAAPEQAMPDLRQLSITDMGELSADGDEHIVHDGAVVAYGEIFEPPFLISSDEGRILVDGVQVVPRPLHSPDFQAQKIAGRLHSWFHLDASAQVEDRLKGLKAEGIIDDYQVWKRHGKLAAFRVKAGGAQARAYMDALPAPLIQRYQFTLSRLFSDYRARTESGSKEASLAWLKDRLEKLKNPGQKFAALIDKLEWRPERETASIRFMGESEARDYHFGEDQSPFGIVYAKRWKARRKQTEAAVTSMVAHLEAGGVLIYSRSFEKSLPADPAISRALLAIRDGGDPAAALGKVRARLKLSEEEARALTEELK